jgi:hypothetical protein
LLYTRAEDTAAVKASQKGLNNCATILFDDGAAIQKKQKDVEMAGILVKFPPLNMEVGLPASSA